MIWDHSGAVWYDKPNVWPEGPIELGYLPQFTVNNRIFHPDGPAPTFRAQTTKCEPPGSTTNLWFIDGVVRNLGISEVLGIMGFPPDALHGVDEALAYYVAGDSVCRHLSSALLREVLRLLA